MEVDIKKIKDEIENYCNESKQQMDEAIAVYGSESDPAIYETGKVMAFRKVLNYLNGEFKIKESKHNFNTAQNNERTTDNP